MITFVIIMPKDRSKCCYACHYVNQVLTVGFRNNAFSIRDPEITNYIKDLFICCKVIFFKKMNFKKVNSGKVNYFLMFGSVVENRLENTFQCLVMSWKMSWKITY
jgi:hypothetical protein